MKKNIIQSFLAITSVIGFLVVMGFLFTTPVPTDNKDFFNICLIALVGFVGTAFGYFLGSSQGSARKTEIIAPTTEES